VFDPPYNQGNPEEYHEAKPNHWHFRATTEKKAAETRIAALMVIRDEQDQITTERKTYPGWVSIRFETPGGAGEAWAQITPGTPAPAGAPEGTRLLAGRFTTRAGEVESLWA